MLLLIKKTHNIRLIILEYLNTSHVTVNHFWESRRDWIGIFKYISCYC